MYTAIYVGLTRYVYITISCSSFAGAFAALGLDGLRFVHHRDCMATTGENYTHRFPSPLSTTSHPPPPGESSSAVAADNCRCCPALNYNVSHITMLVSFFQRWQWRRGCLSGARCLSASALERSSVAAETRYVMNTNLICVSSVPWNRE